MDIIKITALFVLTAIAEIVGCYLAWLMLKEHQSHWLWVPAVGALVLFAGLLTLHPIAAGRTYAAYGGVYVSVALVWLYVVDGVKLTWWDAAGAGMAVAGMLVIMLQPQP
jgi:small multidrug resistance family-3 protein